MADGPKIILREHKDNPGLFQNFKDICQLEGVTYSDAIRFMMKNAVKKFKDQQKKTQ